DSRTIARLLGDAPGITASRKNRRDILYKWTGVEAEPPKSGIQDYASSSEGPITPPTPSKIEPGNGQQDDPAPGDDPDLAPAHQKLICLCERTHRHLSWLSNFVDPALIRRVVVAYPQDFETCEVDLGNSDMIVRLSADRLSTAAPVADIEPVPSMSATQDDRPPDLLGDILDEETLAELRFKPAAPHMGIRRNDPRWVKGDRHRR